MKTFISVLVLFLTTAVSAQYNYKNLDVKFSLTNDQLKPYTFENLRIYPVYAKESFTNVNRNLGKYTPLNEALSKQKVKITETGSSGNSRDGSSPTVNTLFIQNTSDDTVYIMGGEVVKGGKQDRVISEDVILPPKGKKINLDVFCVEHGRWVNNSGSGNTFMATYGCVSTAVRKNAEIEKDQSKVWEEVKNVNDKNKTQTTTGTYAALDHSKDYTDKIRKYVAFFKNQLGAEKNVIGFVAASGDKVLGCDLFATSVLLSQQIDNLLRSYATEAITNGAPVKVSNESVKTYLDKILLNESARPKLIEKNGKEFKKDEKTLHISVY